MFYVVYLFTDATDETDIRVWNYKTGQFCRDIDAAYDKSYGFGYTTRKYANKICKSHLNGNPFRRPVPDYRVVDREELFWYLGVRDWRFR